jgi:hypothetical protein
VWGRAGHTASDCPYVEYNRIKKFNYLVHRPEISYDGDIALSDIGGLDVAILVKGVGAKGLDMKLCSRFGIRQGRLVGVALDHYDTP